MNRNSNIYFCVQCIPTCMQKEKKTKKNCWAFISWPNIPKLSDPSFDSLCLIYFPPYFTEVPETPSGLKVLDKSGRVVQLQWTAPYDGNAPITRYLIEYKLIKGKLFLFYSLMLLIVLFNMFQFEVPSVFSVYYLYWPWIYYLNGYDMIYQSLCNAWAGKQPPCINNPGFKPVKPVSINNLFQTP